MTTCKLLCEGPAPTQAKNIDPVMAKFVDETGNRARKFAHRIRHHRCRATSDPGSVKCNRLAVSKVLPERIEEISGGANAIDEQQWATLARVLDGYPQALHTNRHHGRFRLHC